MSITSLDMSKHLNVKFFWGTLGMMPYSDQTKSKTFVKIGIRSYKCRLGFYSDDRREDTVVGCGSGGRVGRPTDPEVGGSMPKSFRQCMNG